MKINDNYKIAAAFAVFSFISRKFLSDNVYDAVLPFSAGAAVLSLALPSFGNFIYDVLRKFGGFLGVWIARIILFITWIFAVLPAGLLMKITGRDRLRLKKPVKDSYWIDNKVLNTDYEYQF